MEQFTLPKIQSFAEELVKEGGFGGLDEKFRSDMVEQVVGEALSRIGMLVMGEMSDEQQQEFSKLAAREAGSAPSEVFYDFASKSIANFEAKVKEVLEAYRQEFLAASKRAAS